VAQCDSASATTRKDGYLIGQTVWDYEVAAQLAVTLNWRFSLRHVGDEVVVN
jgi:sulfur relay (sulfurtransferase) DsrC/TusE family protein